MAESTVRTLIANPGTRSGKRAGRKKRKNVARRMSLRQKLHFGSKAQRAAAKRAMRGKRSNPHRRRTKAARRHNSAPRKRRANTSKRRNRSVRRRNIGELVVASLGNPATKRRKNTVAKTKRRRKTNASHRRHASSGRRTRRNPSHRMRRHRRNPGMGTLKSLIGNGIAGSVGALGSKYATQMVLGASNTGFMGYLGNIVATGLIAYGTHLLTKSKELAGAAVIGGTIQLFLRAGTDMTPYGSFLSLQGLGDYQVANWATPQWLPNGLKSANPAVPNGWGGGSAVAINSSGAGMGSLTNSPSWD